MSNAQAAREREDPVFGVEDSVLDSLNGLVTDAGDLSEGGFSDINVTIIGLSVQQGGEERSRRKTVRNPETGIEEEIEEPYTTSDALKVHLRIDNAEELGVDDPFTIQYLALPRPVIGADGKPRRAKATKNGAYGLWIIALDGLGVSSNPQAALTYQFTNVKDLVGLQYHRLRHRMKNFAGNEFSADLPVEIFGFDNEIRKDAGLPPAYLIGQEPVTSKRGSAS
jgi:hypothetical protein